MMKRWIDYMQDAKGMVAQQKPASVMRTMAMGLAPLPQGLGGQPEQPQQAPQPMAPQMGPTGLDSLLPQMPTDRGMVQQPHSGFMVPGDVVNELGGQTGLYNAIQNIRGRQ